MGYGTLLFSPNGRIGKATFIKGAAIVFVITVSVSVLASVLPPALGLLIGLISIGMVYPYLCVYGKRLHDAGLTAWFFLIFLIAHIIYSIFVGQHIVAVFAGDATLEAQDAMQVAAQSGDFAAVMKISQDLSRQQLLPNVLSLAISNIIIGAIPAFLLKESPEDNQHGSAPGA